MGALRIQGAIEAMAKAKSPRSANSSNKQVITMPEAGSISPAKRIVSPLSTPGDSSTIKSGNTDLDTKIRQRAYQLYEERGCAPGHEHEDWLQAEREVVARHNHQQSA
jgi:Protein of unknown function (DUF2934)